MIKLQGLSREQVREIARQIADSCDDGADIPEYRPLSIPLSLADEVERQRKQTMISLSRK